MSYLSKRVHILRFFQFWNNSTFPRLSKHETITYFKVITYMEPFHILRFITFWNDSMFTSLSKSRPVPCCLSCPRVDLFHVVNPVNLWTDSTLSRRAYFWIDSTFPDTHDSILYSYLSYLHHTPSLARLACPIASRGLMTTPCPVCVHYMPAMDHWRAWSISRETPIKNASLPGHSDLDLLALWCALLRVIVPLLFCAY